MRLYTYYDSVKADYCGEGALYFAKLADDAAGNFTLAYGVKYV